MPLVHASQTLVQVHIALVVSTAAVWNDPIATTLVMNEVAAMMAFTAASVMNENSPSFSSMPSWTSNLLQMFWLVISSLHSLAEIDESISALNHLIAALEA
jgi:hypothetical protein